MSPARDANGATDGERPENAPPRKPPPRETARRKSDRDAAGDALRDYRAKTLHEVSLVSRRIKESGHPAPLGDPASGVALVVEGPVGPRVLDALGRSLQAVRLPEAYVTYAGTGFLEGELLAVEPLALVAVGPGAAREIDGLERPLARRRFSDAEPGAWFAWTRGTAGILLPPLAPALTDEAAKRRFWLAFTSLRALAPAE